MSTLLEKYHKALDDEQNIGSSLKVYEEIVLSKNEYLQIIVKQQIKLLEQKNKQRLDWEQYTQKRSKQLTRLGKELSDLIENKILINFNNLPKAKVAKIIRSLFDLISKIPQINNIIESLCENVITWCNKEGRTFLRYKIETKLAETYFKEGKLAQSLELLKSLLFAIKKLEDKQMLVEIQLIEAKVYHGLQNLPKAKASLTSVKTASHSIYVAPALQADIDLMSGIISAEENDFNTAYSYFFEAFEGYNSLKDDTSNRAFKYMLMARIMNGMNTEALTLLSTSVALNYQNRDSEAMKEVAIANKEHKLIKFEKCQRTYDKELLDDPIMFTHIKNLYSSLLEENLKRIIQPYSEVQIDFVAKKIQLTEDVVLTKLSEMILDSKINATLDQGRGCLIIFDESEVNKCYEHSLDTFTNLDKVLDSLYQKAQKVKTTES